jgi:tartrate-resistant acid phosphatase type 5
MRCLALVALFAGCTAQSDKDEGTEIDPSTLQERTVRFVALGDGGEGNPTQFAVADAVKTVCESRTCEFALYLGDNFYDSGVTTVADGQFQTKFEEPYANLDFPFYVVLGNHDYGMGGIGQVWAQADPQVEYTDHSEKWTMPDTHYNFEVAGVSFTGLDTNVIFWDHNQDQGPFLDAITDKPAAWHIAFGHHPYVSNGEHGNAGAYEGIGPDGDLLAIPRGDYVKAYFDEHVCRKVDLYLSGHDHDLEWPDATCGTEFIVSGAAAKTRALEDRGTPSRFGYAESGGFAWIELRKDGFTAAFYDQNAALLYEGEGSR